MFFSLFQSHEIISKDEVIVEAESPNGRVIKLTGDGTYNAQFTPDEIGQICLFQNLNTFRL
jgi:hypothetical protein